MSAKGSSKRARILGKGGREKAYWTRLQSVKGPIDVGLTGPGEIVLAGGVVYPHGSSPDMVGYCLFGFWQAHQVAGVHVAAPMLLAAPHEKVVTLLGLGQ